MAVRGGGWGLAGIAVSIMVLVIITGYATSITAEIHADIDINETESPEAYAAVESVFQSAYAGMTQMGTLIRLSVAAAVIGIISSFVYFTRR